ncbi:holin [Planococcus sp. N028]|uniref:Holin n=1 Tax=Planococcus shixiaomingii TaxID=3058393 RepID=A0ABT8MZX1_9BACL|nr:holin [Planococcus sp. N028]MDN7241198.1 holin [Planococcus sp. N028]
MTEVLLFSSIIAPIVMALVEVVKKTVNTPINLIPVIALVIGLIVGFAAQPFSDLDLTLRLWAGVLAGLAGTGLYETVKQRNGESKGGEQ